MVFCRLVAGTLLVAACLLVGPGAARGDDAAQSRVPVVTRLVQRFMDFENRLVEAARTKDAAALQGLLSADFELRVGPAPGVPTPREAWLRQSLADRPDTYSIEQMAVHDLGNFAVVSFLGRRKAGGNLFFVDVWVNTSDAWKLSIRYAAPAGDLTSSIPGWDKQPETLKKRY
jgi:hypothetical protein